MRNRSLSAALFAIAAGAFAACDVGPGKLPDMALYADALDSARSVAQQPGVSFDPAISTDGRGSLRIDASGERTVIELADVPIEAPKLPRFAYRAKLRSEKIEGRAYLEMWVRVKDKGDFFSRALHSQLSGTSDWSTHEAPFFLEEDQEVTRATLNVVIEGSGTLWVDAVTLRAGKN
jgi:hypothetical protein